MGSMVVADIEFVEIPKKLRAVLGTPDAGTRMYRQIGGRNEFRAWWYGVSEVCEPDGAISPGGASMIARVSRMAVYKRMKEGRITAFLFHEMPSGRKWSIPGLVKRLAGSERVPAGCYVPVAELKSWGRVLESSGSGGDREGDVDDDFLLLKRRQFKELREGA